MKKNRFYENRETFGAKDSAKSFRLGVEDTGLATWMSRNEDGWFVEYESEEEHEQRTLQVS